MNVCLRLRIHLNPLEVGINKEFLGWKLQFFIRMLPMTRPRCNWNYIAEVTFSVYPLSSWQDLRQVCIVTGMRNFPCGQCECLFYRSVHFIALYVRVLTHEHKLHAVSKYRTLSLLTTSFALTADVISESIDVHCKYSWGILLLNATTTGVNRLHALLYSTVPLLGVLLDTCTCTFLRNSLTDNAKFLSGFHCPGFF
jgi:hypothetical protein